MKIIWTQPLSIRDKAHDQWGIPKGGGGIRLCRTVFGGCDGAGVEWYVDV